MNWIISIVFLCVHLFSFGQTTEIEGRVVDKENKEYIPYATVINLTSNAGKIANIDGYFRILAKVGDSIAISYTGYQCFVFVVTDISAIQTVLLEQKIQLITDVIVHGGPNEYLYQLLNKCVKKATSQRQQKKAYFELKSTINNDQIELVESYYNLNTTGYEVSDLTLKSGRLALKPSDDRRLFMSQGTTTSMVKMATFEPTNYFPSTPLNHSIKKMRSHFILDLSSSYLEDLDSIYIINYRPKMNYPDEFEGKIWVNKSKHTIQKVTMHCSNCQAYPFVPIFPMDSISNVELAITKTFDLTAKKPTFKQIDYNYSFDYFGRYNTQDSLNFLKKHVLYEVNTQAILYAYGKGKELFFEPKFKFDSQNDYFKIGAYPHNDFFWKNNNEFRMNDQANLNEKFFFEADTLNSASLFRRPNINAQKIKFPNTCVSWSDDKRIFLRNVDVDTLKPKTKATTNFYLYNLSVKLFFDINEYNDSLHILSKTLFDPIDSYYYLPMDSITDCFMNLFFDYCESERQHIYSKLLKLGNDKTLIAKKIPDYLAEFEQKKEQFLLDISRGTNLQALKKWNDFVDRKLGINNMALFRVYESE